MKSFQVLGLGMMMLSLWSCGSDTSPNVPFNVNAIGGAGSGGGGIPVGGHPLTGFWHHQFEGYSDSRQLASSLIKVLPDGSVWLYDLEYGDFEGQNVGVLVPAANDPNNFVVEDLHGLYRRRGVTGHDLYCGSGHDFAGQLIFEFVSANEIHLVQRSHGWRHRRMAHEPYFRIAESQASALIHQCTQTYQNFTNHLICPHGRVWRLERVERVLPGRGVFVEMAHEIPAFGQVGVQFGFQPFEIRFDAGLSVEINGGRSSRADRAWRFNPATSEIWMDLHAEGGVRRSRGPTRRPRLSRGSSHGYDQAGGRFVAQAGAANGMAHGQYHAISDSRMEIHFQLSGGGVAKYCYTR